MDTDTRTDWQARAEAAEAEVKRLRALLSDTLDALAVNGGRLAWEDVQEARAALAQTGGA